MNKSRTMTGFSQASIMVIASHLWLEAFGELLPPVFTPSQKRPRKESPRIVQEMAKCSRQQSLGKLMMDGNSFDISKQGKHILGSSAQRNYRRQSF